MASRKYGYNKLLDINSFIVLILTTFFIYLCSISFTLNQQFLISSICLCFLLLLVRLSFLKNKYGRLFFLFLAIFITLRYWIWRTTDTLIYTGALDYIGTIMLYLAETHGIFLYLTGIFISIWPIRRKPIPLPDDPEKLPTIDIFIPTLNEPEEIVKITLIGCKAIDYPKNKLKIYLLDDGATLQKRNDPKTSKEAWKRYYRFKKMAESLGVNYITRETNEHAKAGNINYAFKRTDGELILILDCDHVPTRDILKKTVGWFLKDKKLFLVQTPHFFLNPDPIEKNLRTFSDAPTEQQMFYQAIQLGLDFWNSSFFCGSAALLKRKYLEEIGGLKGETITEDAETSIALHAKGLNSAYVGIPVVCGLNPETYDSLITQRTRWTQGMIQIFMIKNPLLIKGLKLYQKICYLNCCLFWFFGISRMIFLLAPAAYLIGGIHIYYASVSQVVAYAVPHVLAGLIVGNTFYGNVRWPFFSELYESAQSIFLVPAVISTILNPKKPSFRVTPKGMNLKKDFLNPLGKPFYILCIITLLTFPVAIVKWHMYPIYRDVIMICTAWSLFNFFIILACLGIVWERRQLRHFSRAWAKGDLEIIYDKRRIKGEIRDISLSGIGFEVVSNEEILFNKGQKFVILMKDNLGKGYKFEIEIVRSLKKRKGVYLGCQFIIKNKVEFENLVKFVYGDSQRWIEFWKRKSKSISAVRGFLYLIKKGIEGSLENLRGIVAEIIYRKKGVHYKKEEQTFNQFKAKTAFEARKSDKSINVSLPIWRRPPSSISESTEERSM